MRAPSGLLASRAGRGIPLSRAPRHESDTAFARLGDRYRCPAARPRRRAGRGFLLVRSPGNPAHYWGNLLLFDREPRAGDAPRWEALFDEAFGDEPRVRHRTFAGIGPMDSGAAREEFSTGLRHRAEHRTRRARGPARPASPRESRRRRSGARPRDRSRRGRVWDAVVELQVAGREDGHDEDGVPLVHAARGSRIGVRCSGLGGAPGTSPRSMPTLARSWRVAAGWS